MTFDQVKSAAKAVLEQESDQVAHQIHYRPDAFHSYTNDYFPSKELKDSFGVYVILDMEDQVLYIGKAAAKNLFRETYSKFNTPNREGILFPRHDWTDRTISKSIRAMIEAGDVRLGFITVDTSVAATELERHLHKHAIETDGELPHLNARIG